MHVGLTFFKIKKIKSQTKIFFFPMVYHCARRILTPKLLFQTQYLVCQHYGMYIVFDEALNLRRDTNLLLQRTDYLGNGTSVKSLL